MKKVHTTFPEKAKDLWETWDIRVFILCSLAIQALLTFLAPLRKNSSSSILRFIIWLLYLTADAVGIFVIGLISSNEGDYVHKQELLAFWAPFLLLHLGGPDTITALALEDNELWNRHALQLATQLVITIYVFVLTFRKKDNHLLIFPTMLMLVDGLIKYIERTCALFFASEDSFRDSLVGTPEPGPNYARLMEEYFSAKGAHIPTDFEGKDGLLGGETRPEETDARNNEEQPTDTATNDGQVCKEELKPEEKIVREAHQHYEMFKALLADGFLSLKDRKASRNFFMLKEIKDAVKIIEIELNLIYDVFYTKSYLLQRKRACFRVLCFFSAIASLVYFSVKMSKRKYHTVDVVITFVLLGGAIVLDICAAVMFVLSDWWIILIPFDGKFKIYFKNFMLWTIRRSRRTRRINSSRWSESISGYNLLRRCFREPPSFFNYRIFSSIKRVRDLLIEFLYVQDRKADKEIIEYVVGEIKSKAEHATELDVAKEVCSARGNLVLDNDNFLTSEILNPWTLEVDYDESLLIWHLATDFCYWTNSETEAQSEHCRYSKALSDYMSYILLRQQTMVSSVVGMADTRFEDTSADAKKFINNKSIKVSWLVEWGWMAKKWCCGCCASGTTQGQKETTPELEEKKFFKDFCKKVLEVKADVQPIIAKGDKSKSVLFDACRLAKQLDMFGESKWEIISKVWVELLCYAAVRCSPRSHIARLSKGGELITLVWLYMAHLGLGERFIQNQGFGWTKLIIQK